MGKAGQSLLMLALNQVSQFYNHKSTSLIWSQNSVQAVCFFFFLGSVFDFIIISLWIHYVLLKKAADQLET